MKTERDEEWRGDPLGYLNAGKLSQKCPADDVVEAAGFRCTKCGHLTGPGYWFANDKKENASV